jgi:hypothetical protein
MFKKKNELETNLFDKAMEWYQSGDKGKREAALELFPEDMLKKEIEGFKKRNKQERLKERDLDLERKLSSAKKMFPIGTLIWSDEGTDSCPNLIVSEPYIGNTKYGTHIPYGIYEYSDEKEVKKTILVHTVRIYRSEIESDHPEWYRSVVGLERLMDNMEKPLDQRYPVKGSYFIELDEYHKSEEVERNNYLNNLKESISEYEEKLQKFKKDLSTWESYDPNSLTKEKINEIVEKYKW